MTLFDFNNLDEMEQIQAIWGGSLIAFRKDEVYDINLYQIDGFFVEEYIHRELQSKRKFVAFNNEEKLLSYLGDIKLSGL